MPVFIDNGLQIGENEGAMKTVSFVTLLVLFGVVISPMCPASIPFAADTFSLADDVCGASGDAFSVNADHPPLQPALYVVRCPVGAGLAETPDSLYLQSVAAVPKDHPPET
jgi:hypothetical protein